MAALNLSFSNSETPAVISPQDVGAPLVPSCPRASPSLTHEDGKFHSYHTLPPLRARLSVYQNVEGGSGEGWERRNGEK